ncbi:MAG: aminotransferase class V-fold PLP-dependent enzyme [Burkholderiales bacterium]
MNDTFPLQKQFAALRSEFPGTDKWIYFETSARGLMPAGAREAVARYLDDRILEGGASATMLDVLERVRAKFARLIGAAPDEIAIVKNVSEGINAIVTAWPWQRGDNAVLCADIEHPNSIYALYNMRDRHGIEVRNVPATADHATPIDTIAKSIDDKTRMVIASTVTYTTGARTDLDALAKLCRARDILLLVDGAQSVGALELDMAKTPLDAMTVGASKYLCGPYGFGFLYVRRARAERMQPGNLARYGIDLGDAHEGEKGGDQYKLMPAARRFEIGSYNYAGANALEVSLDLIADIGVPAIEQHVLTLARTFTAGLLELKLPVMSGKVGKHFSHVVIVGKAESDAATESLLQDLHAHLLHNHVKASIRHGRLRFAFHFYNTPEEVDKVLALLRAKLESPLAAR